MSKSNGKAKAKPDGEAPRKRLRNHVAIILDESGSMDAMRWETIGAFNQQVDTIRAAAKDQDTTVSLVKFNTIVPEPVYWTEPVGRLAPIGRDDYRPNGMTAMLDAVGTTIDRLRRLPDADDEDTSFLILIISDGMENNSKHYSWEAIAERIQELDKTDRWTFAYLGANQDLSVVSERMSIPRGNMGAFEASRQGVRDSSVRMCTAQDKFFRDRVRGCKSKKDFFRDNPNPTEPSDA